MGVHMYTKTHSRTRPHTHTHTHTLLSAIPTQLHHHILTFHLLSHLLLETYLSSTSLLPFSYLQHPLLTHYLHHHSFSFLSLQTFVVSFHHPHSTSSQNTHATSVVLLLLLSTYSLHYP